MQIINKIIYVIGRLDCYFFFFASPSPRRYVFMPLKLGNVTLYNIANGEYLKTVKTETVVTGGGNNNINEKPTLLVLFILCNLRMSRACVHMTTEC